MIIMCISRVFGSVSRSGRLFVVGNSALLGSAIAGRRFAFAGPRRGLRSESIDWLRKQVGCLSAHHVVVSGLAIGADTIVHRTALKQGVPQIAVLPSGFDNVYPRKNLGLARDIIKAGGCLVSLLPPGARASRFSFVARNEVIAELGHMLVVPQFEARSGTRHTVNFAQQMGKSIVVQSTDDSGNRLIINSDRFKTLIAK